MPSVCSRYLFLCALHRNKHRLGVFVGQGRLEITRRLVADRANGNGVHARRQIIRGELDAQRRLSVVLDVQVRHGGDGAARRHGVELVTHGVVHGVERQRGSVRRKPGNFGEQFRQICLLRSRRHEIIEGEIAFRELLGRGNVVAALVRGGMILDGISHRQVRNAVKLVVVNGSDESVEHFRRHFEGDGANRLNDFVHDAFSVIGRRLLLSVYLPARGAVTLDSVVVEQFDDFSFEDTSDDIEIEKGAMLLPSAAIPVSNIVYFNVLYRYNWDRKHIEGFVAIALEELADLVIDNSITVYYTGKNSKDTEIYERILKERDEINAGN